jgi:spore maturation protein CgeB
MKLDIVILGLTITSSWGNGHATTYRSLAKALSARGHRVTFLERDVPWYRDHRDLPSSPHWETRLYHDLRDLPREHGHRLAHADLVILGSYVPDGAVLADWVTANARGVTAFYDIDTPVTLAGLQSGRVDYISAALIPRFDLYLSFTGGPVLEVIERDYGSPRARPLYCGVDPDHHGPVVVEPRWTCGYLGTYSDDRQPALERLLLAPAQRLPGRLFVVAGPQYPAEIAWPLNVERIVHLPPDGHAAFYCAQAYTLNLTRSAMVAAGFSPSVRLFEAAACGTPIITDRWDGIDSFFAPSEEILIADTAADVAAIILDLPEERRRGIAEAARRRVLAHHTAGHRARDLEHYYAEVVGISVVRRDVEAVA